MGGFQAAKDSSKSWGYREEDTADQKLSPSWWAKDRVGGEPFGSERYVGRQQQG
jgi:hypothetical protein